MNALKRPKYHKAVFVLFAVALAFAATDLLSDFFKYEYEYSFSGKGEKVLVAVMPSATVIIEAVFNFIPFIMLLLSVPFFGSTRSTVLSVTALVMMAVRWGYYAFEVSDGLIVFLEGTIVFLIMGVLSTLWPLIFIAGMFITGAQKPLIITGAFIALLGSLTKLFVHCRTIYFIIDDGLFLYLAYYAAIFSNIAIAAALLLRYIPLWEAAAPAESSSAESFMLYLSDCYRSGEISGEEYRQRMANEIFRIADRLPPELALQYLNEKYKQQLLTDEDYQKQREAIISKL